ncbi:hypothetical protein, partial [Thermoflexus sp.]|uniref:hypothetical protein n=1 Tax=Thermoflexus sp. TaxID=1969742 RepID=UPI0035E43052
MALREATERGFRRAARLILAFHRAQQRQAREVERRQEDHRRDLGELLSMRLEALYHENPGLFRPPLRCASWRSWRRR